MALLMLSPLLAAEIAGLVWAMVAMGDPSRRRRALFLALGLAGFIFVQVGRIVAHRLIITYGMGTRSLDGSFTAVNVIAIILDTAATALVVIGGLMGSGSVVASVSPLVGSGTGLPPAHRLPPLSTGLRLTLIIVPSALGAILSVVGFVSGVNRGDEDVAITLLIVGFILSIAGAVALMMTLHALWKTIQPPPRGVCDAGIARTTPGAAVGFLFIPLFNFYWVFQAWVGLATDTNKAMDGRGLGALRVPRGLAVAVCVCAVISIIPYLGFLTGLANLIMAPLLLSSLFRAANALRTGEAMPGA